MDATFVSLKYDLGTRKLTHAVIIFHCKRVLNLTFAFFSFYNSGRNIIGRIFRPVVMKHGQDRGETVTTTSVWR